MEALEAPSLLPPRKRRVRAIGTGLPLGADAALIFVGAILQVLGFILGIKDVRSGAKAVQEHLAQQRHKEGRGRIAMLATLGVPPRRTGVHRRGCQRGWEAIRPGQRTTPLGPSRSWLHGGGTCAVRVSGGQGESCQDSGHPASSIHSVSVDSTETMVLRVSPPSSSTTLIA
jgi:hypothetical protein